MSHTPFDPSQVLISLHGCCDYDEEWHPGIEGWGNDDEMSRANGCVSVGDWDQLVNAHDLLTRQVTALREALRVAQAWMTQPQALFGTNVHADCQAAHNQVNTALALAQTDEAQKG